MWRWWWQRFYSLEFLSLRGPGPATSLKMAWLKAFRLASSSFVYPRAFCSKRRTPSEMNELPDQKARQRERGKWQARTSTLAGSTENLEVKVKVITKRAIGKIIARAIL